jgi:curved DNA-binding protein CbpA
VAQPPAAPAPAAPKPPAPVTQKPAAPAAPARPAPKIDAKSLRDLAVAMKGKDHFEVLGVKRDAPAAQVKVAYFQLAKAYHPDAVAAEAGEEVRKLAAEVFAKVSEAWGVLGDENRKKEYLEELASGGPAAVDVARIFEAENTFQLGTLLVKGRKYDEALKKFDEALVLNPDESEFGMWKAWCEFLLAEDRKRAYTASTRSIQQALERNPRCAPGYLFLGQMAKLVGDLKAAERHLKRGIEMAADTADLVRELKYLSK